MTGADSGSEVPPRGGRVTWASGVRSRAMRVGPLRVAGSRLSGARPGGPRDGQSGLAAGAEPGGPRDGQSGPAAGAEPGGPPGPGGDFLGTAGVAVGRTVQVVIQWVRRHPLEAVAVVLLGLGGLIYPPIWLIGALVATFSKAWSISDKWIGLALPVFLVIVGIVVEVSLTAPSALDHLRPRRLGVRRPPQPDPRPAGRDLPGLAGRARSALARCPALAEGPPVRLSWRDAASSGSR